MNIDPLNHFDHPGAARVNGHANNAPAPRSSANHETDQVSTSLSSRVRDTLAAMPEVRPEVVERGRQLAADPHYPSADIMQKIAALITPLSEE